MLRAGFRYQRRALPLPCDVVRDKDVGLILRDGTTIYADVFRPAIREPGAGHRELGPLWQG